MQDYFLTKDIVPHAVVSPTDSPLSITGLEPDKLLDFVLPTAVVRVLLKNYKQFFECFHERRISL